jgi:phage head maturation protease
MKRRVYQGCRYRGRSESGTFGFVAATQAPVETAEGPEILLMSGADLSRYLRNPVILDNHSYGGSVAETVVGRGTPSVAGDQLLLEVEFDEADERSARVAGKVDRGFLRAVSVGWIPVDDSSVVFVPAGKREMFGGLAVDGPARVVTEWQLLEVSVVGVPADQFALARGFDWEERAMPCDEEKRMDEEEKEERAEDEDEEEERKRAEEEEEERKRLEQEKDPDYRAEGEEDAPKDDEEEDAPSDAEKGSRGYSRAAVDSEIRGIAPKGMRALADRLVLDRASVARARKAFKAALRERCASVGSREPSISETKTPAARKLDQLSSDEFSQAFSRLGGFPG